MFSLSIGITVIMVAISVLLFLLSIVFRIAGKLRLALPLAYLLIAVGSLLFTDWASKHDALVTAGFFALVAYSALSWVVSLVKAIRHRARDYS